MTLICTVLSRHGIAMSSDTAIYKGAPLTDLSIKTIYSKKLNIGISAYGLWEGSIESGGKVKNFEMNYYLQEYINTLEGEDDQGKVKEIAERLAHEVNDFFDREFEREEIGFHVAGYEESKSGILPVVFHVVVDSGTKRLIAQPDFHENSEFTKKEYSYLTKKDFFDNDCVFELRNGDWEIYAELSESLRKRFDDLKSKRKFDYPIIKNIDDLGECAAFNVQMMTHIYRFSTKGPTIGGPVNVIIFDGGGLKKQYFRVTGDYNIK